MGLTVNQENAKFYPRTNEKPAQSGIKETDSNAASNVQENTEKKVTINKEPILRFSSNDKVSTPTPSEAVNNNNSLAFTKKLKNKKTFSNNEVNEAESTSNPYSSVKTESKLVEFEGTGAFNNPFSNLDKQKLAKASSSQNDGEKTSTTENSNKDKKLHADRILKFSDKKIPKNVGKKPPMTGNSSKDKKLYADRILELSDIEIEKDSEDDVNDIRTLKYDQNMQRSFLKFTANEENPQQQKEAIEEIAQNCVGMSAEEIQITLNSLNKICSNSKIPPEVITELTKKVEECSKAKELEFIAEGCIESGINIESIKARFTGIEEMDALKLRVVQLYGDQMAPDFDLKGFVKKLAKILDIKTEEPTEK